MNSHTDSREGHLADEVGTMVLEPGCEGQYWGPGAQRCEGSCHPGEDGRHPPLTGPGHRACHIARKAKFQRLWNIDVGGVSEGW